MQYGVVQYSVVQYSVVQYSAVHMRPGAVVLATPAMKTAMRVGSCAVAVVHGFTAVPV